VLKNYLAK